MALKAQHIAIKAGQVWVDKRGRQILVKDNLGAVSRCQYFGSEQTQLIDNQVINYCYQLVANNFVEIAGK